MLMHTNKGKRKVVPAAAHLLMNTTLVGLALHTGWAFVSEPARELYAARHIGADGASLTVDALVVDLASLALMMSAGALAVLLALALADAALGHRMPRLRALTARVAPRTCRRVAAACIGVGVLAPATMGAQAFGDGGPHRVCPAICLPSRSPLAGLPLPDLPIGSAAWHAGRGRGSAGHDAPSSQAAQHLVVQPGDSLWLLAQSQLAPHAADGAVQSLTARLYALNRSLIGDDPDLILPGMTLRLPEGTS